MNKFLRSLLLSSTFALAACSGHKPDTFETTHAHGTTTVVSPRGFNTGIIFDNLDDRYLDINATAIRTCEKWYKNLNFSDSQPCTINIRDTRNDIKEEHGFVKADCDTSFFNKKSCAIRIAYKPL